MMPVGYTKLVQASEIPPEWLEMAADVAKAMSEIAGKLTKDMPPEVYEMAMATFISGTMNWNARVSEFSQAELEEEFFENVRRLRGAVVPQPPN